MALPYMPLYIGDYLRDTQRLKATAHGAYLLLLMDMWNNDGEIADDPNIMASIARVNRKAWPAVWRQLEPFFTLGEDAKWRHNRLQKELQKAAERSRKRAIAGAQGGKRKALKYKETPEANATDEPSNSSSKRLASQSHMPEPDTKASKLAHAIGLVRAAIGPGVDDPDDCGIEFAVEFWTSLGAAPETMATTVRRATATMREKPIRKLRAITPEIEAALVDPDPTPAKPAFAPGPASMPDGIAGTAYAAVAAARGPNYARAWLGGAQWNGTSVYLASAYDAQRVDSEVGHILREHGYQIVVQPSA